MYIKMETSYNLLLSNFIWLSKKGNFLTSAHKNHGSAHLLLIIYTCSVFTVEWHQVTHYFHCMINPYALYTWNITNSSTVITACKGAEESTWGNKLNKLQSNESFVSFFQHSVIVKIFWKCYTCMSDWSIAEPPNVGGWEGVRGFWLKYAEVKTHTHIHVLGWIWNCIYRYHLT